MLILVDSSHLYTNSWHCLGGPYPEKLHLWTLMTKSLKKHYYRHLCIHRHSHSKWLRPAPPLNRCYNQNCVVIRISSSACSYTCHTALVVTALTTWLQGCVEWTLQQAWSSKGEGKDYQDFDAVKKLLRRTTFQVCTFSSLTSRNAYTVSAWIPPSYRNYVI